MSRRAFTAIELLVSVSIIAILASILIPSIMLLIEKQKYLECEVRIDSLHLAVDHYLGSYAALGEHDEAGNLLAPLKHLHTDLAQADRHLDLVAKMCLRDTSGTLAGPFIDCLPDEATHMKDGFSNPILMQVVEEPMPGLSRIHLRYVLIRSLGADTAENENGFQDDIVHRLDTEDGTWRKMRMVGIDGDGRWQLEDW